MIGRKRRGVFFLVSAMSALAFLAAGFMHPALADTVEITPVYA